MTTTTELRIPTWTMADRLRKSRLEAGLSQQEIADAIGISRKTVTNYENGDTHPLRAILNAWCEVTHVPIGWVRGASPEDARPFPDLVTTGAGRAVTDGKHQGRHLTRRTPPRRDDLALAV